MRLSSDSTHPDYCKAALPAIVYLNGELVKGCVHADEEAGTVVCHVLDDRGWVLVDGAAVQEVTLHGQVDIVPRGEHFDSWMKRRTERAHAEYMARHAAGGVDYGAGIRTYIIGRLNGAPAKEVVAGAETRRSIKAYKAWLQGAGHQTCDHEYHQDRFGPEGQLVCMYCRDVLPRHQVRAAR